MATLSVQRPTAAGVAITLSTPVGADKFVNTGKETVQITNAGASPITVTFDSPGTCNFEATADANHDVVVTVAAGATKIVGPLSPLRFNDTSGYCNMTYSVVADTRMAILGAA